MPGPVRGWAEMRPIRPLRRLLPQRPTGLSRHVLPERPGRAGAAGHVVPVLRGGGRQLGRLPEGREQRPAELLSVVLMMDWHFRVIGSATNRSN